MSSTPERTAGGTRPALPLGRLFLLAFVTGFSGAVMPGPLLVAVIGQTAVQGFGAAMGLITGHALLELVTVALLVLGLQASLARPRVRGAIGLVGGAGLVWMGADMLRSVAGLSLDLRATTGAPCSWPRLLIWGAAVCAANPYFTGWWATVGAGQLAHMAPRTLREYAAFYLGHEASDFSWYALVGLVIVSGESWLTDELYRGLVFACALLVLLIGVWFAVTGTRFLAGWTGTTSATEAGGDE